MGNKDVWGRNQSSIELASMASCPLHLCPFFDSCSAAELGVSLENFLLLTMQIYMYSKQSNTQCLPGLWLRCWTKTFLQIVAQKGKSSPEERKMGRKEKR